MDKTDLSQLWVPVGGGYKERENEYKHEGCILDSCTKIEYSLLKLFYEEGRGRERKPGGITKIYCKYIYKCHKISPCSNIIC
jgi:hypothetical protein